MIGALHSSETSILTRTRWHNIPEDGILHSHCRENVKSYRQSNSSVVQPIPPMNDFANLKTFLKKQHDALKIEKNVIFWKQKSLGDSISTV
jgi:hypothetical protein